MRSFNVAASQFVGASIFVVAILTLSAAPAQAADSEFPMVTKRMQQFVDDGAISGAVTLVASHGKVVHLSAVGLADVDKKTPMAVDAPFAIASMTKPITATAFMMLVDEGKASIDDPVEKYIPAFKDAKLKNGDPVRGLKIRHLLTHTSGMVGSQDVRDSLEATADKLAARPFEFQPGEKWSYSPGMNVVGRIIEVVSGESYEKFLNERIFKPLAMTSTTFHPSAQALARVPTLYNRDQDQGPLKAAKRTFADGSPESIPSPSGGLFSTAGDMRRFYQMILDGGVCEDSRLVSAESVKAMTTVQTGDIVTGFTPGNGWGLGWCIVREPQDVTGMLSPGTFGHGGAFGTQGWVDPKRQAIFLLLIQRAGLPNSDASDMRKESQRTAVEALGGL